VLEATVVINATDTIEDVKFGIVAGSINSGDFLINGMVPPVTIQPPFLSMYQVLIVTGRVLDIINRTVISFDLYAMVNTANSGVAMPSANVTLLLPGK